MASPRRQLRIATMIALVAVVTLAGCSNDESTADLDLPAQNIDRWVMPIDQYEWQWEDRLRSDYAYASLDAECLRAKGYDIEVPWRDMNGAIARPSLNSVGRHLFTLELASNYGYQGPPSPEKTLGEWLAYGPKITALGEEGHDAFVDCRRESSEKQLPMITGTANRAAALAQPAWEGALESGEVRDATSAWRECMLPLGVADLPERPLEMPPSSLRALGDHTNDPTVAPDVSPREIEVAVADFECRESSGYRDALYQAEWDRQVDILRDNMDALVRSKQVLSDHAAAINEILGY